MQVFSIGCGGSSGVLDDSQIEDSVYTISGRVLLSATNANIKTMFIAVSLYAANVMYIL